MCTSVISQGIGVCVCVCVCVCLQAHTIAQIRATVCLQWRHHCYPLDVCIG